MSPRVCPLHHTAAASMTRKLTLELGTVKNSAASTSSIILFIS